MNNIDIYRLLLIVIGIGGLATDQIFQTDINKLFGVHAAAVLEALSALSAIASTTVHTLFNPTTPVPTIPTPTPAQYHLPLEK